ncbi:MAG: tetratricopeptide repeat protein [Blastocatellia bacterium]
MILCFVAVPAAAGDTVVVMPFENRSQMGQYNWIRESFSILLAEVLDVPGIVVLGKDERNLAFDRLRLSPNDLLTRAAMIRVADASQANLALIGEFDIGGEKENATIAITARLIETREGRLVGNKVFNFSGPLSDLQRMQGQMAWNIVYVRNPSLPYSRDQLVRKAMMAPPKAYESLVKAVQTGDPKLRESFLRRAIQEYDGSDAAGHYGQALYELGSLLYRQNNFAEAIKQFKELNSEDPNHAESLFYLGLAAYKAGDLNESAAAYEKLAEAAPLLEILNNTGGVLFLKGDREKALQFLRRAVANSPNDPTYRFNFGYALWRNQNYAEAVQHLQTAIKANPRDGEAHFVLAKALAAAGREVEAGQAENEAKRHLESYARWTVAPDKVPSLLRLKPEFNRAEFYKLERKQHAVGGATAQQISLRQSLDRAHQLVTAKNDVEAFAELQRALAIDSTNAEAYFLRAVVMQRNNQTEGAISALQTAVSWNPRMVEAHVLLGRIYLARGDRAQSLAHCRQALEIDPQNRDAIALKQQIETGR